MDSDNNLSKSKLLNNKSLLSKNNIGLIIIFVTLLIFYSPLVFEGLEPGGIDTMAGLGKKHNVREYTEKTGDPYLWNPNIFAGVPEYFSKNNPSINIKTILRTISNVLDWRITWFLIGAIGMFLLLNYLKFPWYFSILGSLAFLFFPHIQGLILVGHNTKIRALMYIPMILFTFLNFTKKRDLFSISFFILFFSAQFQTKHYQVVFYTLLLLLTVGIYKIVQWIKEKKTTKLYKSLGMFIPALVVAVLMSALPLFVAQDYTPYSTRGGNAIKLEQTAEQTQEQANQKSKGVSFEYATQWSYSLKEYLGTIIPKAMGGTYGEVYQGDKYPRLQGRQLPTYWGDMRFTQSVEYFGIIIVVLAIAGIVYYRKNGFVISLTILLIFSFLLSLGKHFPPLYKLLFYYLPYFSKFRVPMMILTLMDFLLIVLAMYGLKGLITDINQKKFKQLAIIGGIFGFIGLICIIAQGMFSFSAPGDARYNSQIVGILKNIRKEYLTMGALRMLVILGIFLASVWLFFKKKINALVFSAIVLVLIAYDLISVSYQYFDNAQLSNKEALERRYFRKDKFDKIMEKSAEPYRVFGMGQLFQSNDLAYHHQTVGGYSAIKPQLIQNVIDNSLYITRNGQQQINWEVVNMLNAKYVIAPGKLQNPSLELLATDKNKKRVLYKNKASLPRVYFVDQVEKFENEREVLKFMNSEKFAPGQIALTSEKIEKRSGYDTTASAKITDYSPNQVTISAKCNSEAFMILADAYFPVGWTAKINGEKTQIYQVNHVLRGIRLPAGQHRIVFTFRPDSYQSAKVISTISTYFVWLLLIVGLVIRYRETILSKLKKQSNS